MDSARDEHETKETEMPRLSKCNAKTLVDLVSEEDDHKQTVEFEPLEQPSDADDVWIEADEESTDDEVNGQNSSDQEVNEQNSSDDEVNEQDDSEDEGNEQNSSDDEVNEQVNERDAREASSGTNIPITSTDVQPSSELASTGAVVSTDGPVPSTNGPATSTNGPATSTNGPATSTNGPATSTNGPATSTNGVVGSTNGPATSTNGPVTSKTAHASSKSSSLELLLMADSITSILKPVPEESTPAASSSKKRKMTNDDDHDSDISGLDEGSSSDSEDDDDEDEDQEKKQDDPSAVSKKSTTKKERDPNLKESRKDKRLSLITARFVEYLIQSSDGEIDFAETAEIMGVKKRRIYDVINVLEGCELVERLGRSRIRWCGPFSISKLPPLPERIRLASDDHSHRTPKARLRARYPHTYSDPDYLSNLAKIQRLGEAIDESLKVVRTGLSLMAQKSYVDVKEMKLALDPSSQKDLVLISTPGSAIIRVHAPLLDITANTVDVLRAVSVEMEEVKEANGLSIPAAGKLSVSLIHPVQDRCIVLSADVPAKVEPKTSTAAQLFRTTSATISSVNNDHPSFTPEEFLLSQDTMEVMDKLPSSLSLF